MLCCVYICGFFFNSQVLFWKCVFNFQVFGVSPNFFLLFLTIWLWSENILCMISMHLNSNVDLLSLVLGMACGCSWKLFHVHFKRICIPLSFGKVSECFKVHLVNSVVQVFYILSDFLSILLSVAKRRVLKSPIVTVKLLIYSLSFVQDLLHFG